MLAGTGGSRTMALFGKRQVDAQVGTMTWTRLVQLERQEWVSKRGNGWVPFDETRNVKQHTETYWGKTSPT